MDDIDLSDVVPRDCSGCGVPIQLERLFVFPDVKLCVSCASRLPKRVYDPDTLCAKASGSCQNGFAPKE